MCEQTSSVDRELDDPRAGESSYREAQAKPYNPEHDVKSKAKAARRYALESEAKNWSYDQLCKEIEIANQESKLAFDRSATLVGILQRKLGSS